MSKNHYETEASVSTPRVVERDRHLVPYLVYPFLGALALSSIFALCIGALAWAGEGFETGLDVTIKVFCISLLLSFPGLFLWRGMQWAGPRVLAEIDHGGRPRAHTEPKATRTRVIPVNRRNNKRDASLKIPNSDIIDPEEFCDVLFGVWPTQDLTRGNFAHLFRGGQRLYYRYVGGRGRRGLWDKLGIISQDKLNGAWSFNVPLNEILAVDRDLQRYANREHPPTLSG